MDITTALLLGAFVAIVVFWLEKNRKSKKPPGPIGLPILGYIPFLSKKPYIELNELAKKYGSVFSIRLGSQNAIVLNDFQSTKEAFSQDAFIGRPPENPFDLTKENLETGAFNGLPWKEQRKFSLQLLKDLGFGKSRMEDMIREEICDLLEHLEKSSGKPTVLQPVLAPSMSNNISVLVFGKRLRYGDPVRNMLDRCLNESAAAAGQVVWQIFFPWLAKTLKFIGCGQEGKIDKIQQEFKNYTLKEIEEHERTLDENNVRDYIDGYLLQIKKRNDPAFCKGVLQDMVGTFFGAGSETVRLTTDWLILTIAAYPDIQAKVHEEIDRVVGRDRLPSSDDRPKMPYCEAVIMEVMRYITIIPINILRYTLWDTELNGYFIPKNSYVLSNLWSIHHNPDFWGDDVEEFRPERFLTADQKETIKREHFVPFSIGKRSCPGEMYARMECFEYFVSILQKFSIALPPGKTADFDGTLGIGLGPKPQKLCFNKRY
ncbi:hypothetical protein JTE90_007869 [Oedothorax gibbosus]|uniref:Cytochrome P450 n=1 Tax=Oedothorax gibbosus TaxID=931172 RepID=A0AAV6VJQ4_9ARAC|nr:hypothetical protein JTE90_007869 [Oedothorax gibbosus]